MCFAVVCCKVGMNYADGGAVLSGLFGLCGGEGLDPGCSFPVKRGFRKGVCRVKNDTYIFCSWEDIGVNEQFSPLPKCSCISANRCLIKNNYICFQVTNTVGEGMWRILHIQCWIYFQVPAD